MSKEITPKETPEAEELIARFARCKNYPFGDTNALDALADDLERSSERYGVPMSRIVEVCVESSSLCPTGHDLLQVGLELRDDALRQDAAKRNQRAEWERQYGPARPAAGEKCSCCGREWNEIIATAKARKKELWGGLRKHFHVVGINWPESRDMAPIARQLGFPDIAKAWERL